MARGLAGLLIVRGEIDRMPEIALAREHHLVLQDFDPAANGVLREPSVMERMVGREGPLITVNGRVRPQFSVAKDGWARLRILNASASPYYRLRIEEHSFFVIGVDGGPLPAPVEMEEWLLAPGERVELMARGARAPGSYRLLSLPYRRGAPIAPTQFTLADLVYEGEMEGDYELPGRLASIDPLPAPFSRVRSFTLAQGMMMSFTINGRTFRADRVDTEVALGAVEDWEFVNTTAMDHPMHVHTNAFQVIGSDGEPVRAWKDVVNVPAQSRTRIRIAFRDYTGISLYHCHILDHEDLGMMGTLAIR